MDFRETWGANPDLVSMEPIDDGASMRNSVRENAPYFANSVSLVENSPSGGSNIELGKSKDEVISENINLFADYILSRTGPAIELFKIQREYQMRVANEHTQYLSFENLLRFRPDAIPRIKLTSFQLNLLAIREQVQKIKEHAEINQIDLDSRIFTAPFIRFIKAKNQPERLFYTFEKSFSECMGISRKLRLSVDDLLFAFPQLGDFCKMPEELEKIYSKVEELQQFPLQQNIQNPHRVEMRKFADFILSRPLNRQLMANHHAQYIGWIETCSFTEEDFVYAHPNVIPYLDLAKTTKGLLQKKEIYYQKWMRLTSVKQDQESKYEMLSQYFLHDNPDYLTFEESIERFKKIFLIDPSIQFDLDTLKTYNLYVVLYFKNSENQPVSPPYEIAVEQIESPSDEPRQEHREILSPPDPIKSKKKQLKELKIQELANFILNHKRKNETFAFYRGEFETISPFVSIEIKKKALIKAYPEIVKYLKLSKSQKKLIRKMNEMNINTSRQGRKAKEEHDARFGQEDSNNFAPTSDEDIDQESESDLEDEREDDKVIDDDSIQKKETCNSLPQVRFDFDRDSHEANTVESLVPSVPNPATAPVAASSVQHPVSSAAAAAATSSVPHSIGVAAPPAAASSVLKSQASIKVIHKLVTNTAQAKQNLEALRLAHLSTGFSTTSSEADMECELDFNDPVFSFLEPIKEDIFALPNFTQITELVLTKGRPPQYFLVHDSQRRFIFNHVLDDHLFGQLIDRLEGHSFTADHRMIVPGTLHRISRKIGPDGLIYDLTVRIGRTIPELHPLVQRELDENKSILFLGRPGSGKTCFVRDCANYLSQHRQVEIVDTSSEIAGFGSPPHPAVGWSRVSFVPSRAHQHEVMLEAVQNHCPDYVVVDEMGTPQEVEAARDITQRGVRMVASVHSDELESLIKNPKVSRLLGDTHAVILSDAEMRARKLGRKTIRERKSPSCFDVLVFLWRTDCCIVVRDVDGAIDGILDNRAFEVELRFKAN